jgi:hypothetical protein
VMIVIVAPPVRSPSTPRRWSIPPCRHRRVDGPPGLYDAYRVDRGDRSTHVAVVRAAERATSEPRVTRTT